MFSGFGSRLQTDLELGVKLREELLVSSLCIHYLGLKYKLAQKLQKGKKIFFTVKTLLYLSQ